VNAGVEWTGVQLLYSEALFIGAQPVEMTFSVRILEWPLEAIAAGTR